MYSTCQDEPAAGPLPSPEEPPGRETLQAGRTLHPVVSAEEGGFRHVETIFIYYILKDSWRAQSIFYKAPPAPRVYLKDSWQEAYVIHMENKDLHVAIVFSPICGPIGQGLKTLCF